MSHAEDEAVVPAEADPEYLRRDLSLKAAPDPKWLEAVFDLTPECVKIVASDGRLLHINDAGLGMIQADSWRRVAGADTAELIAPEHRERWRDYHQRVCRGERLSWQFDMVGLEGVRRHMETHAAPIDLRDGTIGQLAITRDVSARLNAERALHEVNQTLQQHVGARTRELEQALARLRESERSFALLVDGVTDYALFMLDTQGTIVSWNAGAERIKGYAAGEIIGRHFSCFYTRADREAGVPERGLATATKSGRFETEGWRVRKDGSRFLANVIIDAIRDKGELVGFAKITRDITERTETEARLREAQKMEAVGQFTGGAAHDFNNLLMAILGSLELLRKRLPGDVGMRALLDNAMQGARRGAALTQRMLAFARRQELKREAVDLPALFSRMQDFLQSAVGPLIDVTTDVPRHLPPVCTDATQLESALQNLALNARDAMPGGGMITITAREMRVESGREGNLASGDYICIAVRDVGHGMDEATLARATEPFFTTKGIGKGTGLGLSMVDGLVAQSGGRLVVRSELGRGTTVELWLPVADDELRASPDQVASTDATLPETATRLVVLAVDDDSLVLMNIAAMLEDLGHRVIDVGSAAAALDIIDSDRHVDLVISDQAMPGMTGVELFDAIRARRPQLRLVLATGYAELPVGSNVPVRRLAKPFTQRELAEVVADAMR